GLWAGYARHRMERVESAIRGVLGRPLARWSGHLAELLPAAIGGVRALADLQLPPAGACARKHEYGFFDDDIRRPLYTRHFAWQVRDSNPLATHLELHARCGATDPLLRALYLDARTSLPDSTLLIADRTSAAA